MKALADYVRSGKFFESVVEDGSDIIFIVDFTGTIHYHNPSVKEVLGYKRNSLIGKNFFDYILEETAFDFKKRYKVSTQKKYSSSVEFQFLCRDNTYRYLEFNSINLKFKEKINGLILDCRDITQRKKDALELIRAQKAKELFLANISHEIRTPINGISGMASLLSRNPTADEQATYLSAIKSATDNLKVILNDILDLALIESGKLKFETIAFSLKDLLASLKDIFFIQAQEKGIDLQFDLAKSADQILVGDPVKLNQILINLIGNALKFTHSGFVKVIVSATPLTQNKSNIKFEIQDTGIGIPSLKLTTIFESFSQADASVTRKYGGTGLGLTIVKQLVELQKGIVYVESKENIGSTFRVTIPYKTGNFKKSPTAAPALRTKRSVGLVPFRVLLVEDNDINRLYASSILKAWDCTIHTAENGLIALQKLKMTTLDIVLMDIQMPIMDGFEATQAIRASEAPLNKIPIIALTANATKQGIEKCLSAGMNECVVKPFTPDDLFSVLKKYIKPAAKKSNLNPKKNIKEIPDLTYLKGVAKGDNNFVEDMISTVLRSLPPIIDEIKNAPNKEGNALLLATSLHKIKPSLTMLGLHRLKNEAMELEQLSVDSNQINSQYERILSFCQDLSDSLHSLKQ